MKKIETITHPVYTGVRTKRHGLPFDCHIRQSFRDAFCVKRDPRFEEKNEISFETKGVRKPAKGAFGAKLTPNGRAVTHTTHPLNTIVVEHGKPNGKGQGVAVS